MSVIPVLVVELVGELDLLKPVLDQLDSTWRPDSVPITVAMGDVGAALANAAELRHVAEVVVIFQRLESILQGGTESEKDAAATGFLEAVAAVLDQRPEQRWILAHAGNEARLYLAAWDRFCGVKGHGDPDRG